MSDESASDALIPGFAVALIALICAVALLLTAALGPLGIGMIHYKTSQSGTWQIEGNDFANLLLMVPLLILGALFLLLKKPASKYFLILTPITLMYTGLSYGVGEEWGNPAYTGNVENYFWLFLVLIIGGLFLMVGSFPMFSARDAPNFGRNGLRIYVGVFVLFFLIFAAMWISQILQVIDTGDLSGNAYSSPQLYSGRLDTSTSDSRFR